MNTSLPSQPYNPLADFTDHFWGCECTDQFIHHHSVDDCPKCEALRDDQPNSTQHEIVQQVGDVFDEVFARFQTAVADLLDLETHVHPTPFEREGQTFEGVLPYVTFALEKYLKTFQDPDPMGYRAEVVTFRTTPRNADHNVFTVTPAHLAMLKRLSFVHNWGDYYVGGAAVSHRRPYGNRDLYGDVAELAGLPTPNWDEGEDWSDTQIQHMLKLHYAMAQVLNMAVERYPEPLTPGLYTRKSPLWPWQKQLKVPEQVLVFETYGACPRCETDTHMDGRDCLACDYQAPKSIYVWVCPVCGGTQRLEAMPPTIKCDRCDYAFKVANFIPPEELLAACQAEDSWLEEAYEDRFELGDWD